MRLMNFENSIVLTWTFAILGGVGALGLCAMLAYVLAMLKTGWFNVVVLAFCAVLAVVPAILHFVRARATKPTATGVID